jgi:hypothetical protein
LLFTGESIDTQKDLRIGFANRIIAHANFMGELAHRLKDGPLQAIEATILLPAASWKVLSGMCAL